MIFAFLSEFSIISILFVDIPKFLKSTRAVLYLDNNPNYNTVYLQGVLNYKKVFCLKNDKSSKILNEIPNTFIESHEWLCDQITNLHKITMKDLYDYYNIVKDKHLDKEFSKKLIEYIEE